MRSAQDQGVDFEFDCALGKEISLAELAWKHDAVHIAVGARKGVAMGTRERAAGRYFRPRFLRRVRLAKVAVGKRGSSRGAHGRGLGLHGNPAKQGYLLYRRTRKRCRPH
jgi:NADPH-dependent glutamate synthase beta subunit-like oxidoreductase